MMNMDTDRLRINVPQKKSSRHLHKLSAINIPSLSHLQEGISNLLFFHLAMIEKIKMTAEVNV